MSLSTVLRVLGHTDGEVHSVFRAGSRVYGTATAASDEDFVAILARRDAKQDLAFSPGVNVVVHGLDTFRSALAEHSVFALECLFLPPEHRLKETRPAFPFKLDRKKLAASAASRSASDFKKAGARFDEEPAASKKKLFHALRVPLFAVQIAEAGAIHDYGAANPYLREIVASDSLDWEEYRRVYGPLRERLCERLAALSSRR
ncbi:hypothetical protein SOCE26_081830 [Sorangium cellulosum]|uniref:Polymerase nucleotidyl transferase domain-containing protein n=1 Tax=Sorangium cellulosum TaxID=56 RepID=A0A2L0F558_SORCE|nr:hypothetical protein [Sorangium cellulosum]AUX46676.1 hypothetical protein SOCE26_081830 [Sorangium cellulosum]